MSTPTTQAEPRWTVEGFASFWADPDINHVKFILTDDVTGYWTGRDEPYRGKDEYAGCIAALVGAVPGVRVEINEHAESGPYTFIRWTMHGEAANGPFTVGGMDRIRLRDGLVAENYIVFDSRAFERAAGIPLPWV
jgi:hypothetical protein